MEKPVVDALSDVPSDRYTTFWSVHDMMVETCFYDFQGVLMADMQTLQKAAINSFRVHCLLSIYGACSSSTTKMI